MSCLKDRIKKLEVLVFGEEDQTGLTMEELLDVWRFQDPAGFKKAADRPQNPALLWKLGTPLPGNIDRLEQIWKRCCERNGHDQALHTTNLIAQMLRRPGDDL